MLSAGATAAGGQVAFMGVNTSDQKAAALNFLARFGIRYRQLADPSGDALRQLRFPGLPVTIAVGTDGTVRHKPVGPVNAA